MRIIEGTVEEIVEYQRRTGTLTVDPADSPTPAADDELDGSNFAIRRHIYSRAGSERHADAVLSYIKALRANGLAVEVKVGKSKHTTDGKSDYLMVRGAGKHAFGAVVYVEPSNGTMTYRLREQDIEGLLDDKRIGVRAVASIQEYRIRTNLVHESADLFSNVTLAFRLTERALEKITAQAN